MVIFQWKLHKKYICLELRRAVHYFFVIYNQPLTQRFRNWPELPFRGTSDNYSICDTSNTYITRLCLLAKHQETLHCGVGNTRLVSYFSGKAFWQPDMPGALSLLQASLLWNPAFTAVTLDRKHSFSHLYSFYAKNVFAFAAVRPYRRWIDSFLLVFYLVSSKYSSERPCEAVACRDLISLFMVPRFRTPSREAWSPRRNFQFVI